MTAPERLVVVGGGMAAVRLVEELRARSWPGEVTVLADEDVPPYNRILLSAVLGGTHDASTLPLRPDAWWDGVDLRLGTRVASVDRAARTVLLESGEELGWDRLVLATGSIPTLPPIRGLVGADGRLHPRVHAFRSLADCRRLDTAVSALPSGARAVVVGGGLLGLQVARALSDRGVATEVVEGQEHLLAGQVGPAAGAVLARDLRRLGTEAYTGARAVRLTEEGLRLDNGYVLDCDLVVLTAGGRPSTSLARAAGLDVRRGILVDGTLTAPADDRVHAIGDCAQPDGRPVAGFVPPAWEQAGVLAARLCGEHPTYDGSRSVVRLRATGLDVAVLGDPLRAEGEAVEVSNPVAGSLRRLVVADRRIVAATLVGDLSRVGLLTQLYERGTAIGEAEAGELLLPERASAPTPVVDEAEVCACSGATAGDVRRCAGLADVRSRTRATTGCGGCLPLVQRLLGETVPVG